MIKVFPYLEVEEADFETEFVGVQMWSHRPP